MRAGSNRVCAVGEMDGVGEGGFAIGEVKDIRATVHFLPCWVRPSAGGVRIWEWGLVPKLAGIRGHKMDGQMWQVFG